MINNKWRKWALVTAWKVSKYRVFSGPYFPAFGLNTERYSVFSPNAGKYGPEKNLYLDTFHAVCVLVELFLKICVFKLLSLNFSYKWMVVSL